MIRDVGRDTKTDEEMIGTNKSNVGISFTSKGILGNLVHVLAPEEEIVPMDNIVPFIR